MYNKKFEKSYKLAVITTVCVILIIITQFLDQVAI